jgi:hypothetical protein
MKRIPVLVAVLTAIWLVICHVEYGFRGLNPDVESDWVLRPVWWHSDFLADCGFWLLVPTMYESFFFDHLFGRRQEPGFAFSVLFILSQVVTIVAASFAVFWLAKLLIRLLQIRSRLMR